MIRRFSCVAMGVAILASTGCSTDTGGAMKGSTASQAEFLRTDAEVVVVDFFDMYCHTCQTAASHVNDLHGLVRKRGLGSKIAFYAIGWGNTAMEADLYRTRFDVPFPVIPDRERTISLRYGDFRPPLLLALRRDGGGWKEIYRTKDPTVSPEDILGAIWH
jgi:thiol-disulfide isomerase/thioredoxin